MYYCNNCDIAYEERDCPLCAAYAEIENLKQQIEDLESREE
jgi:hypothetical protein